MPKDSKKVQNNNQIVRILTNFSKDSDDQHFLTSVVFNCYVMKFHGQFGYFWNLSFCHRFVMGKSTA